MTQAYVLIHSPLLAPMAWRATGEALRALGHKVVVPDLRPAITGPGPYYPALAQAVADVIRAERIENPILVVHSVAGALVPALTERVRAHAIIFVDAMFPFPGKSWFDMTPTEVSEGLTKMAQGGKLPTWDKWSGDLDTALPDAATRKAFIDELLPTPLAFLQERSPSSPPVKGMRVGFLQITNEYAEHRQEASWMKWGHLHVPGGRLEMMTQPARIAEALDKLTGIVLA